jgi:O-acetyl-ADP-ribose deacetylase (regulator of RNase III)
MSELKAQYMTESGQMLQARQGDLSQEDTDAIVNAANSSLAHGGGVAGAIVRRGGSSIQAESDAWVREHGQIPTGQVAVTGAGRLACRSIIHAVGPVWHGGGRDEEELLRSAAWNSLVKAHELELTSIALPAISSGIFGFPKERCAEILVRTALDFCEDYPDSPLREIRFTNIDRTTADLFVGELDKLAD